ncbi:hypothetical protein AAC387_Pa07g1238 [Persea americana]
MANWLDLHQDLLVIISNFCIISDVCISPDYIRMQAVCKSWRSVLKKRIVWEKHRNDEIKSHGDTSTLTLISIKHSPAVRRLSEERRAPKARPAARQLGMIASSSLLQRGQRGPSPSSEKYGAL